MRIALRAAAERPVKKRGIPTITQRGRSPKRSMSASGKTSPSLPPKART